VRFCDETVFSKCEYIFTRFRITALIPELGNNAIYSSKLTWQDLVISRKRSEYIEVRHYRDGPVLGLQCVEFIPTDHDVSLLYFKSAEGWSSMMTTTYSLGGSVLDMEKYVASYVTYFLKQTSYAPWLSRVLLQAEALMEVRPVFL
jgi:hypothetical protein